MVRNVGLESTTLIFKSHALQTALARHVVIILSNFKYSVSCVLFISCGGFLCCQSRTQALKTKSLLFGT